MVPTPAEVLALIAAGTPWFPAQYAEAHGLPRSSLDSVLSELWKHELIEARDWVKGLNQGFGLTEDGERAAKDPAILAKLLAGQHNAEAKPRATPTTYDRGERARHSYYNPQRPIVTQSLILLNIAVFIVGLSISWRSGGGRAAYLNGQDLGTLIRLGAVSGDWLLRGEWWRILTANFVHIGLVHLLLNVYCLGMVGALAEDLWGRRRFLAIYLVSGLAGSSLAMMLKPGTLTAGASGATWGVMTSLGVWLFLYRQHFDASFVEDFARRIMLAVLLNGAVSFWPRVSWEGHMGGAIGGVVMAFAVDLIRPGYRRRTIAGVITSIAFPLLIIAGLLLVAVKSATWRPLLIRESLHQQAEYFRTLEPELDQISPLAVSNLVLSFQRTKGVPLRFGKVREEAKQLLAKAEQVRSRIGPTSSRLATHAPEKAAAYCESVITFTKELLEYLNADRENLDGLSEVRKQIDDRWLQLRQP